MAGEAIPRCGFEVDQAARIDMAQHAFHVPVTTGQPELGDIMIEAFPEYVHAIMTVQAGPAK